MSSVKWWPFCSYISVLKWFLISSICLLFGTYIHEPVLSMMTISNANILRVTGLLWGESTDHGWISLTKTSQSELWYFLWSAPEQTVGQTIETSMIWDPIVLIMALMLIVNISKLFWHLHKMQVSFKMHFSVRLYIIVATGMTLSILQTVTIEFETSGNDHRSILLTA